MNIPAFRQSIDLLAVIGGRVQLTRRGKEHYGLCPFHKENTPSFTVSVDKGFWHCFGCGMNGDAIDFVRETEGLSFIEACQVIRDGNFSTAPILSEPVLPRKSTPEWISSTPPSDAEQPNFMVGSVGPSYVWEYRNKESAVIGYVARYNVEHNGEVGKTFRPFTWGRHANSDEEPSWQPKTWSKPRPLYGLELLSHRPNSQVIIVEGEKACDAARKLFPNAICLSWPGGSNSAKYVDWSPLYGRSILTIADNDEAGIQAMRYICATLSQEGGCKVVYIEPEPERQKGWDLADAEADNWDSANAVKWAKSLVKRYVPDAPARDIGNNDAPSPAAEAHDAPHENATDTGRHDIPALPELPQDSNDGGHSEHGGLPDVPPAFSDDALAMQFVASAGGNWRYISSNGKWIRWDSARWKIDQVELIKDHIRLLLRHVSNFEAASLLSAGARKSLCSSRTRASVYEITKTDPSISSISSDWNADDLSLATPDGIVDLRTGEMSSWRKEILVDRYTSVSPGGECPRWKQFLAEVAGGDIELCDYLQRLCGYFLTGLTSEHVLAFFYGTGANGKSVFINTVSSILGDYAANAQMETFTASANDRHSTELARLDGARLVTSQETESGKQWAESRIKSLTGGDKITARYMRQDYFEFTAKFKLLFAGNAKPGLRTVDEAIRRRIHIVPFEVTIPPENRDAHLSRKLRDEMPGILQWMIEGCVQWQKIGLCPPASVIGATNNYLQSEDAVMLWVSERCLTGAGYCQAIKDLYANYKAYCEEASERPLKRRRLMQSLETHGFGVSEDFGVTSVRGLALKG